eukprot:PhM_4_TR15671/c0_g1_i2/m.57937/K00922/PIK3CA_B_D; phosphatidylinositol-4,5-bisphosphate 3-kinase catalytic subunit alpha/beta/delta
MSKGRPSMSTASGSPKASESVGSDVVDEKEEEELNLAEEFTKESAAAEILEKDYEKRIQMLRKERERVKSTSGRSNLLQSGDQSPEAVATALESLLGKQEEWCTSSEEVKMFRRAMASSFEADWKAFSREHPGVSLEQAFARQPTRYFVGELAPERLAAMNRDMADRLSMKVIYAHGNPISDSPFVVRTFSLGQTADGFIDDIVRAVNEVSGNAPLDPTEHILKVVGRAEYLYGGDQPLINYQHVRGSLMKNMEIKLFLQPSKARKDLKKKRFHAKYATPIDVNAHHENIDLRKIMQLAIDPDSGKQVLNCPTSLSTWNMNVPIEITINEVRNITLPLERCNAEKVREGDDIYVCLVAELVFGGRRVAAPQATPWRVCKAMAGRTVIASGKETLASSTVMYGPTAGHLAFKDLLLCNAPRELQLSLTLVGVAAEELPNVVRLSPNDLLDDRKEEQRRNALMNVVNMLNFITPEEALPPHFYMGWANTQLFDHTGRLHMGPHSHSLWASETRANPIGVVAKNMDPEAAACSLEYPKFALPVVCPRGEPPEERHREMEVFHHDRMMHLEHSIRENKIAQLKRVKMIVAQDPLYQLSELDKVLLWEYRRDLTQKPRALGKFLLSLDWTKPSAVCEAYTLMYDSWKPLTPMDALELLDARFRDIRVREYAVSRLDQMPDHELANCVLQLVQVLKYEPYHDSALARFLLRRSLMSPLVIGHPVFWHLKAELVNPQVCERHGLILEEYIRRLMFRHDIVMQNYVVQQLLDVALAVKVVGKSERLSRTRENLQKLKLPDSYTLALNPTMEAGEIIVEKCKVMDSKKLPLWVVFKNADPLGDPIYIIFKAGDDLRQDLLTLQLISLMDNVWKNAGLDLHMIPYGCVATGDGVGMIEVVLSSDTVANITRRDGGAQAAWKEEPLMNFLRLHNKTRADVERCLWNFLLSCAGYAVCTYILGIGDRHNDNIMLRQD